MKRRSRTALSRLESLETRCVLDSVVVFNELMYHPADDDLRGEWIELRNQLSVDVDLSDWTLRDGVEFTFPRGSRIPADGYALIVADPAAWQGVNGTIFGPFTGSLDNGGERIELRNNSARRMDELDYDDEGAWPVAPDGTGPSLAKQNVYWTSLDAANWEPSRVLRGTPGRENVPIDQPAPQVTQVVPLDATWRYDDRGIDQGTAWRESAFDDRAWPSAPATFFAGVAIATDDRLRIVPFSAQDDAGIRASSTYTHAIDFGNADAGATINGVKFQQITTANYTTIPNFQWSNSSGIRSQGRPTAMPAVDGPLREVMQDYFANTLNNPDGTATVVLSNLTVGTRYRTRVFARKTDTSPRNVTLEFDHGRGVTSTSFDENNPPITDADSPFAIEFEFTAASNQLTIKAIQHDGTHPFNWYGITNEVTTLTGATEISKRTTHYFRTQFNFLGSAADDHTLELQALADDGAVVYLNGQEIYRQNMPTGPIDFATSAVDDVATTQITSQAGLSSSALYLDRPNVLAVELHQRTGGNDDVRFASALSIRSIAKPLRIAPAVRLNEIAAWNSDARFVELINIGTDPVALSDLRLERQGSSIESIPLPNQTLAPQQIVSLAIPANGLPWANRDALLLMTSDRAATSDAQRIRERTQARAWDHDGDWWTPSEPTPGATNRFSLTDSIVINEIMYHHAPQYRTDTQPFVESTEEWVELYNRGTTTIDLSGWELAGGIDFEFAPGTQLAANSYLVVAADQATMKANYPTATIVGNFRGALGDGGDRIVLRDAVGNPADEVTYYDAGAWPVYADGGGSSLELRDPRADNQVAESWGASHEETKAPWVTVTYEGRATNPQGSADPNEWQELVLGLLDAGEILLDDISVIEDPQGVALERMQNGTFEQGADHWRFRGTHGDHGLTQVVTDDTDPANHVLHVVATGATEHMGNNIETTFANSARIDSTKTYRISFRARWLAGSPQLLTRLYFNRLAMSHILPQPTTAGTPGQPNSQRIDNQGPTFSDLSHTPAVPRANQGVTVRVAVDDPDNVSNVKLLYARDGQAYTSVTMQRASDGYYEGGIPAQPAGQVMGFYVEATDQRGALSRYPAAGAPERLLYRVNNQLVDDPVRHSLRIVMAQSDLNQLFTITNYTSNERKLATVIWQDSEVYYNVEVRLKGSGFSRGSAATGFNMRFSPEHLLFGEHDVVSIDRQGGPWGIGASHREMTIKHIANRAGNIPMMYDDIIQMIGPRDSLTGTAQFLVARYDDVFLDSQYENGSDGTRYKFELIYYSTLTDDGKPEGKKLPPGSMKPGVFPVRGVDMPYMGADQDAYRWHYLIRNQRDRDDYSGILAMTKAMGLTGSTVGGALDLATQAAMGIDEWMRLFAFESLAGINDTFNQGLEHNLELFVRPSDGRVVPLPWDMDFSLHQDPRMAIYGTGSRLTRVINIPTNRRIFQQHLWDIMQTAYRVDYLEPWVQHLGTRAQANVTSEIMSYITTRRAFVISRLAAHVDFQITTPNKDQLQVDSPYVTLDGKGWIDVREIRRKTDKGLEPVAVKWLDGENWQVTVPLVPGEQTVELQAYDLQGTQVGTATAKVTSTVRNRLVDGLRVTEIDYHPAPPSASEIASGWIDDNAFEFVELTNIGSVPLELNGVRFAQSMPDGTTGGIEYTLAAQSLAPGATLIVAANPTAFTARHGNGSIVVGPFEGQLANGGERLTLLGPGSEVIQQFIYDDAWYATTDGVGATLEIRSPSTTLVNDWSKPESWQPSREIGGTPGRTIAADYDHDGRLTVSDIDLFCAAIGGQDRSYDLDVDQDIDVDDLTVLIEWTMRSQFGDVNLDGTFGTEDLVLIFQRGEYEDAIAKNSGWEEGDWNCDREFDSSDLVWALQRSGWNG